MKIFIIVIALLIGSCGTNHSAVYVKELTPYIKTFENTWGHTINNTMIAFTDILTDEKLGLCLPRKNISIVYINKKAWYKLTESQKELLLFHELGHCVLKIYHHVNGFLAVEYYGNGPDDIGNESKRIYPEYSIGTHRCPSSIMRWYMFSNEEINGCYDRYKHYYFNELFSWEDVK